MKTDEILDDNEATSINNIIKVSASILSANLINIEKEINLIQDAGADMIHIDVMDGHFVPNITFGMPIINAILKCCKIPVDVHLMISNTDASLDMYLNTNANVITVHNKSVIHLDKVLTLIKSSGALAGVALLPSENISCIEHVIDKIDLILLMTVNPGFSGQKFIKSQVSKISMLNEYLVKQKYRDKIQIQVDGGIDDSTSIECIKAGVDCVVSGSYIFSDINPPMSQEYTGCSAENDRRVKDYKKRIKLLKGLK